MKTTMKCHFVLSKIVKEKYLTDGNVKWCTRYGKKKNQSIPQK